MTELRRSAVTAQPDGRSGSIRVFEHIVVAMMENRSFDHLLGWVRGADGRQAGLATRDAAGQPHQTYPLAPDFQGCGHADPDHSYTAAASNTTAAAATAGCAPGANDLFSIGYYRKPDLHFFGQAVPHWTVLDRYFAPIMAETYPNRIYQHAAQTDRITNTDISVLPTIWDRLADAGVDGPLLLQRCPVPGAVGGQVPAISRPFAAFLADAAPGTCRRSRSSTRASSTRRAAPPATITRTPTSATARLS